MSLDCVVFFGSISMCNLSQAGNGFTSFCLFGFNFKGGISFRMTLPPWLRSKLSFRSKETGISRASLACPFFLPSKGRHHAEAPWNGPRRQVWRQTFDASWNFWTCRKMRIHWISLHNVSVFGSDFGISVTGNFSGSTCKCSQSLSYRDNHPKHEKNSVVSCN